MTVARVPAALAVLAIAAVVAVAAIVGFVATSGTASASPTAPASVAIVSSPTTSPSTAATESPIASASVAASPVASASPSAIGASGVPRFDHIYLIMMENHAEGAVIGNADAPYLNGLVKAYGLATNYTAVGHPSMPNYLALFAGSTFGISDDANRNLSGKNLADQLEAHGMTWHVYEQDVPAPCSRVTSASGGKDLVGAAGTYVRKHNPAINFTDISGDPSRCAQITRLAEFDPAAADYELIVPNLTNDMHDGTVAQGDAFLKGFVPKIIDSPAFANGLLLITWDEGSGSVGGGGKVATIVIANDVPSGMRSSKKHDHLSLIRTVEDSWNLGCLAHSCQANNLREFFPTP